MDLIPYLQRMIQQGGTALVPSGRGLQRTYGQFSEVPQEIGGPSQPRLGYIHNGEVQPPPRETFGKPAPRMGPLIDGEVVRGLPGGGPGSSLMSRVGTAMAAESGSMASMANPLLAALMGSLHPDLLNNHKGYFNSPNVQVASRFGGMAPPSAQPTPEQGPAFPQGAVSSAPIPDAMTPADQVANRFGASTMNPVAARFGQFQPPSSGDGLPGWLTGANLAMGHSSGFPQPQQAMAQAPPSMPMPQPRPAAAPQAQPEMGFFQRNAAMMRDPVTGMLIDPQGAAAAGDQGSIIKKMLGYLHNKADNA